eukprot:470947_1
MGNVIIHIKDKWSESKTFDPIELRVFHRYVIIKYWDAYHESAAGILFGGALESGMRYVFTMKCVDPYAGDQYVSERLTRFQLALVNLDYKVGYPVSGSL